MWPDGDVGAVELVPGGGGGGAISATASVLLANSSMSASASMGLMVLETLVTRKLRSFSRANKTLLFMPIFFASSWMRILIQVNFLLSLLLLLLLLIFVLGWRRLSGGWVVGGG
jgi:hypothetical protein